MKRYDDRNITGDEIIWRSQVDRDEGEDEKWNGEGARKMAGGRWLAVDGQWSMGWQLAGGVNLVIPPGTAVRDARACYEVVVLVTVPDKPRLAPCFLLLPLIPHC